VLGLITFLPFSVLMFMVPVLLAVCMVFACVPEVLYLLFGTKCSTRRKLKSFVPTALVNVKRYLGSTLHYFLSSTYNVVNTLLLPTKEQRVQRSSKRKALDRMFFMFLLMNHGRVGTKSAGCSPFRLRQELSKIPQVIPQDLSAEMLPPWENIPQGWSQRLPNGNGLKQFDPDNVIPVPEMIDPNTGTTNPASLLIQGAPRLPKFQVPKLFILDQCTGVTIMCLAGVVGKDTGSSTSTFDANSELVGIDNRSSVCMSPHRLDFIGKLIKSKRFIKAFGGTKSFDIYIGTLKWVFDDDRGIERTVYVPESFYIPEAPARLLSPQHWAQEAYAMSNTGNPDATYCKTFHNRAILYWGEKPYVKTVSIDSQNVFTFGLKSGFSKFSAFCTKVAYDAEKDEYAPDCTDEFLDDKSVTSTVMDIETLDDFDLDNSSEVPEGVLTDSEGENSDSEGEEVNLDGE